MRVIKKVDRDEWKMSMEEKFNDEVELDRKKVRKMVPQRFHKWLKVFEKSESEKMSVRKP